MSEPIDINAQILALLQRQVGATPAVTGIAPAFGQPAPMGGALPNPVGLLVPVKLDTRDGEVGADDLNLPAEFAAIAKAQGETK